MELNAHDIQFGKRLERRVAELKAQRNAPTAEPQPRLPRDDCTAGSANRSAANSGARRRRAATANTCRAVG